MKFISSLALAMIPGVLAGPRTQIVGVDDFCFKFKFEITSITYDWKVPLLSNGMDVDANLDITNTIGDDPPSMIEWGEPTPPDGKSSLAIVGKSKGEEGKKRTVSPNKEFTIAELTHENQPVTGVTLTNVTLCITIKATFDTDTVKEFAFEYDIGVEENIGKRDRVFVLNDPSPHDVVSMMDVEGEERTFEIDLIGFKKGNGNIIEEGMSWRTREGGDKNAKLKASLKLAECPAAGYGGGDPHFQTFTGNWYDFHGGCDMHLVDAPHFGDNGLTIDVRTKARDWYSFIETAAIKIGDDVFEVSGYGTYFFNGVEGTRLPKMMDGKYHVTKTAVNKKRHEFVVALDNDQSIVIKTFKDLVSVSVQGAKKDSFVSSRGLMGDFKTGKVFSRDGKRTILSDPSAIAREWQVRDDETVLFQSKQGPQYPEMCTMPKKQVAPRLGNTVARDAAEKACAHWENPELKEMCVQDVIKTGDIEIAAETI